MKKLKFISVFDTEVIVPSHVSKSKKGKVHTVKRYRYSRYDGKIKEMDINKSSNGEGKRISEFINSFGEDINKSNVNDIQNNVNNYNKYFNDIVSSKYQNSLSPEKQQYNIHEYVRNLQSVKEKSNNNLKDIDILKNLDIFDINKIISTANGKEIPMLSSFIEADSNVSKETENQPLFTKEYRNDILNFLNKYKENKPDMFGDMKYNITMNYFYSLHNDKYRCIDVNYNNFLDDFIKNAGFSLGEINPSDNYNKISFNDFKKYSPPQNDIPYYYNDENYNEKNPLVNRYDLDKKIKMGNSILDQSIRNDYVPEFHEKPIKHISDFINSVLGSHFAGGIGQASMNPYKYYLLFHNYITPISKSKDKRNFELEYIYEVLFSGADHKNLISGQTEHGGSQIGDGMLMRRGYKSILNISEPKNPSIATHTGLFYNVGELSADKIPSFFSDSIINIDTEQERFMSEDKEYKVPTVYRGIIISKTVPEFIDGGLLSTSTKLHEAISYAGGNRSTDMRFGKNYGGYNKDEEHKKRQNFISIPEAEKIFKDNNYKIFISDGLKNSGLDGISINESEKAFHIILKFGSMKKENIFADLKNHPVFKKLDQSNEDQIIIKAK